jgi:hypothetical protein
MATGTSRNSIDQLLNSIRPLQRRVQRFDVGRFMLFFIAFVLLAIVVLLWLDTIWALPAAARWGSTRIGGVMAGVAFLVVVLLRWRTITPGRIAKRADRVLESGGEVLAGWQLATLPVHPGNDLSKGMAAIASQQAATRLQQLAPQKLVDRSVLRTGAAYLAGAMLTVIAISGLAPELTRYQIQRFLFPALDLPPFTGTIIELEMEEEPVLYGQDAPVAASIIRGRAEQMQLVVTTGNGQEQVLPMLAENEHHWKAILTRVTEPLDIYARSGISRSQKRRLEVQLTPQILNPTVVMTPPAYTRGSVYRGPIPEQGIQGLKGTLVAWEVSSNRPLANGHLRLTYRDGRTESVILEPAADAVERTTVFGQLTLSQPAQFECTIEDVDGIASQEKITGSIQILEDRRPVVRITRPQKLSLATPDVVLPVVVNADDDYGITKLVLYRSLNGSPATPIEGAVSLQPRIEHSWQLALPQYQLQSGDEIQLFARTEDNDPAGAKGAESPVTTIRIISVSEFQELMVQRKGAESIQAKYQAARRHFDQLSSELRKLQEAAEAAEAQPESAEAVEKLQEQLAATQQAAKQAAEEITKLSQQAMPIDVDEELADRLKDLAKLAEGMQQQLQGMSDSKPASLSSEQKQSIEKMLEQSGQSQKSLTNDAIDPLGTMQDVLPLMMAQQQFTQLAAQQRDLSQRLRAMDSIDKEDPATQRRLAELESEQEQLKQQLEQLLDTIEQQAAAIPDNDPELEKLKATAQEFVDAVRDSQAKAEMSAAQQGLLDADAKGAQGRAEAAAEILESFISKCSGMGEQGSKACKAAFKPSSGGANLGNSLAQMLAMMGMKPGQSGNKPGMGMGAGAGGGFAQRFPGPQNIGLYGSLPMPQNSPSRGRGDQSSAGMQSSQQVATPGVGAATAEDSVAGSAAGQGVESIPADYRDRVAEYFRTLSENLGEAESANQGEVP